MGKQTSSPEAASRSEHPHASRPEPLLQPIRVPERFYGDGPPHWQEGRNDTPAETAAQAERNWKRHIKRLRRQAKAAGAPRKRVTSYQAPEHQQHLVDSADIIESCRPGHRCHHDACPLCMRARQRWFVWTAQVAIRRKLNEKVDGGEPAVLSVVPNLRLAPGASTKHIQEQLTRLVSTIRKILLEAGIEHLIGGIDISANEDRRESKRRGAKAGTGTRQDKTRSERHACRYQLHLWAIGLESDIRKAEAAIRKAFERSTTVRRPVLIGEFDGDDRGYAYALKTSFTRRISYSEKAADDDAQATRKPGSWKSIFQRRNTRGKAHTR